VRFPLAQRLTRGEALALGRLVLVAEDDTINQKVILRQLELLGFVGDVAGNGAEALAKWRTGQYALLLTDLHMPGTDGYALARAIREAEPPGTRLPILALSANALRGEAERATAAGMDEFLGKPVALERLNEALQRWAPALRGGGAAARPLTPWGGTPLVGDAPLEVALLERLIGRDPAVVREFLHEFRATAARQAQEIRDAATHGDLSRVTFVAHKLKSNARSVGALPFGELCADLERVAKLGDGAGVFARLPRFDEQLDLLLGAVDAAVA
jgi:CheY-like chemotaxis protein/HPt (histidine-containing phosphotransfer) domain-containing protein